MRASCLAPIAALTFALAAGCGGTDDASGTADTADLTGTSSVERGVHFQAFVYVPVDATDAAIQVAIARQVKTAIGALRAPKVALNDRASRSNLDPSKWTREVLDVIDPKSPGAPVGKILRVRYPYDDRAVVTKTLSSKSSVDLTMLADDYAKHDAPLKTDCTDDPTTETDSLWYHYQPQRSSCQKRQAAEVDAIRKESLVIGSKPGTVGLAETQRWFMPVTAKLDPPVAAKPAYPEYDRLYGLATDRSTVAVYAFTGVDKDESDPDDYLAQEHFKLLRTMLRAQPNFRPVKTDPQVMLLDLYVDGAKLDGVTYERMFQWLVDKTGYPKEVGADAGKILALRKQAAAKFAERWVYWDLPVDVNGKKMTFEVRTFWGWEDGSADARQHAQWRYLEAFWYADAFIYNGHSHFGPGPLEPTLYGAKNFNDRYQLMQVNSCISFNYYEKDFLDMKPGGSKNLGLVTNGLPSNVVDSGLAVGNLVAGLVEAKKSFADLLGAEAVGGYDPMRVADGELDNVYDPAKTPIVVKPLAPVYP
jgi:hypothetical protein